MSSVRTLPQPVSPYGIPIVSEFVIHVLQDPSAFDEERFSVEWMDEQQGILALTGLKRGTRSLVALFFVRDKGWSRGKVEKWLGINPLTEGKKPPTLKAARRPVKKRKRSPSPPINLVQRNPPTNRHLIGETMFLADSWHGLLGPTQEWLPRAAIENAPLQRKRRK